LNISVCTIESLTQLRKKASDSKIINTGQENLRTKVIDFLKIEKNKPELRIFIEEPSILRRIKGVLVNGKIANDLPSMVGHTFASVVNNKGEEFFFGLRNIIAVRGQALKLTEFVSYLCGKKGTAVIYTKPSEFHVCKKIPITPEDAETLINKARETEKTLNANENNKEYQLLTKNCTTFLIDLTKSIGLNLYPSKNKLVTPVELTKHFRKTTPKKLFLEV